MGMVGDYNQDGLPLVAASVVSCCIQRALEERSLPLHSARSGSTARPAVLSMELEQPARHPGLQAEPAPEHHVFFRGRAPSLLRYRRDRLSPVVQIGGIGLAVRR